MIEKHKKTIKKKDGDYKLITGKLLKPYNEYCTSKRVKKQDKLDEVELKKVVAAIFKEIGIQLVEQEGGVFINNFGYFFVLMYRGQERIVNRKTGDVFIVPPRQTLKTRPIFIPYGRDKDLQFWGIASRTFKGGIYKKIRRNVVKLGKRYKGYPYTMRSLLKITLKDEWVPYYHKEKGT